MKFTQEHQKIGQELYQELVQKAWESTEFKDKLIDTPNLAIESITGKAIDTDKMKADRIVFKVEDQTDANIIYLNIPQKIDLNSIELTQEQLDLVSGGDGGFFDGLGYALMDHAIFNAKMAYYVGKHLINEL